MQACVCVHTCVNRDAHGHCKKKIAGDKEWFDIVYAKKLKFT